MKTIFKFTGLALLISLVSTSCIVVTDGPPGPAGRPGYAYFGISYDDYRPYSYWDNNPDVPVKPYFDEYYPSDPGVFDFEYFVNRYDYWYGTYEIWLNPGEAGRPNGVPGRDGLDTYLLLICNTDGPYTYRKNNSPMVKTLPDGTIQYEIKAENGGMRVTMKKASVKNRKTQNPKVIFTEEASDNSK